MSESLEPTYLAECNPDAREKNIVFYEEGHKYVICGDSSYTSVTTFVHTFVEKFDADKIIAKMKKSVYWMSMPYYGMSVDEIKAQWDTNRVEAADAGTKLHYDIECYYNRVYNNNLSIEWDYFMKFYEDYGGLVPYRTEMKVYHEELKLVGTIDMIFVNANNPDEIEIYDWKRSKEITKYGYNKWMKSDYLSHMPDANYWHYSLQLNIYKAIIEAKYGKKVVGLYLVCLHPNNRNKSYQRINCADLSSEVAELFEERRREIDVIN